MSERSQLQESASQFIVDGKRVCPHQVSEVGCWWVRSGNPHTAAGYGCICLVPPAIWTKGKTT